MRSRGITLRSDRFHERRTAPSIYEIKNVDSLKTVIVNYNLQRKNRDMSPASFLR